MMPEIAEAVQEMLKIEAITDGTPLKPQLKVVEPTANTLETAATRHEQRMRAHIRSLLHNNSMPRRVHHTHKSQEHRIDVKGIHLGGATGEDRHLSVDLFDHPEGSEKNGHRHTYAIHVQEFKTKGMRKVGRDRGNSPIIENIRQHLKTHLMHKLHGTSITSGGKVEHVVAARRGHARRALHIYTRTTDGHARHYIAHIRHTGSKT